MPAVLDQLKLFFSPERLHILHMIRDSIQPLIRSAKRGVTASGFGKRVNPRDEVHHFAHVNTLLLGEVPPQDEPLVGSLVHNPFVVEARLSGLAVHPSFERPVFGRQHEKPIIAEAVVVNLHARLQTFRPGHALQFLKRRLMRQHSVSSSARDQVFSADGFEDPSKLCVFGINFPADLGVNAVHVLVSVHGVNCVSRGARSHKHFTDLGLEVTKLLSFGFQGLGVVLEVSFLRHDFSDFDPVLKAHGSRRFVGDLRTAPSNVHPLDVVLPLHVVDFFRQSFGRMKRFDVAMVEKVFHRFADRLQLATRLHHSFNGFVSSLGRKPRNESLVTRQHVRADDWRDAAEASSVLSRRPSNVSDAGNVHAVFVVERDSGCESGERRQVPGQRCYGFCSVQVSSVIVEALVAEPKNPFGLQSFGQLRRNGRDVSGGAFKLHSLEHSVLFGQVRDEGLVRHLSAAVEVRSVLDVGLHSIGLRPEHLLLAQDNPVRRILDSAVRTFNRLTVSLAKLDSDLFAASRISEVNELLHHFVKLRKVVRRNSVIPHMGTKLKRFEQLLKGHSSGADQVRELVGIVRVKRRKFPQLGHQVIVGPGKSSSAFKVSRSFHAVHEHIAVDELPRRLDAGESLLAVLDSRNAEAVDHSVFVKLADEVFKISGHLRPAEPLTNPLSSGLLRLVDDALEVIRRDDVAVSILRHHVREGFVRATHPSLVLVELNLSDLSGLELLFDVRPEDFPEREQPIPRFLAVILRSEQVEKRNAVID